VANIITIFEQAKQLKIMKPQAQVIFTFDNDPQQMSSTLVTAEQFDCKQKFFKAITEDLTDEEKQTLVKVSCSIKNISVPNPNHWYLECKGKFWDDEIPELIQKIWNLESIITPVN